MGDYDYVDRGLHRELKVAQAIAFIEKQFKQKQKNQEYTVNGKVCHPSYDKYHNNAHHYGKCELYDLLKFIFDVDCEIRFKEEE